MKSRKSAVLLRHVLRQNVTEIDMIHDNGKGVGDDIKVFNMYVLDNRINAVLHSAFSPPTKLSKKFFETWATRNVILLSQTEVVA